MKQYWTNCRDCKEEIVFIKNKDGKNLPINRSSLTIEERQSLAMDLIVPYEALTMRKHFDTCNKRSNRQSFNYIKY